MNQTFPIFKALLWKQTRENMIPIILGILINVLLITISYFNIYHIHSKSNIKISNIIIAVYFLSFFFLIYGKQICIEYEKKTLSFLFSKPIKSFSFYRNVLCISFIMYIFILGSFLFFMFLPNQLFLRNFSMDQFIQLFLFISLFGLFVGNLCLFISSISKNRITSLLTIIITFFFFHYFFDILLNSHSHYKSSFFLYIHTLSYFFNKLYICTPIPFFLISILMMMSLTNLTIRWKLFHSISGHFKYTTTIFACLLCYIIIFIYGIASFNFAQNGMNYRVGSSNTFYNRTGDRSINKSKFRFALFRKFWSYYNMEIFYTIGMNEEVTNPLDISRITFSHYSKNNKNNNILLKSSLKNCFSIPNTTGKLTAISKYQKVIFLPSRNSGLLKTKYRINDATQESNQSTAQLISHLDWSTGKLKITPVKRIVFHYPVLSEVKEYALETNKPGYFDDTFYTKAKNKALQTIYDSIQNKKLSIEGQQEITTTHFIFKYETESIDKFSDQSNQLCNNKIYWMNLEKESEKYIAYISYLDLSLSDTIHYYLKAYSIPLPSTLFSSSYPATFTASDDTLVVLIQQLSQNSIMRINLLSSPPYSSIKADFHSLACSFIQKPLFPQFYNKSNPGLYFFNPALFICSDNSIQVYTLDQEGKPSLFARSGFPGYRYSVSDCTQDSFNLNSVNVYPVSVIPYKFITPLPSKNADSKQSTYNF